MGMRILNLLNELYKTLTLYIEDLNKKIKLENIDDKSFEIFYIFFEKKDYYVLTKVL